MSGRTSPSIGPIVASGTARSFEGFSTWATAESGLASIARAARVAVATPRSSTAKVVASVKRFSTSDRLMSAWSSRPYRLTNQSEVATVRNVAATPAIVASVRVPETLSSITSSRAELLPTSVARSAIARLTRSRRCQGTSSASYVPTWSSIDASDGAATISSHWPLAVSTAVRATRISGSPVATCRISRLATASARVAA